MLVHEMVHCWQHSAFGQAPGGLIEGVADWVRLKAGYAPPHWRRHVDCDWDAGYERTGYFLAWLEKEHGEDVVRRINEAMRGCEYDGEKVWRGCCGKGVDELWEEYKKSVGEECGEDEEKEDDADEKQKDTDARGGDDGKNEKEAEVEEEEGKGGDEEHGKPTEEEDRKTDRDKARRGGNMNIPIRPRFS